MAASVRQEWRRRIQQPVPSASPDVSDPAPQKAPLSSSIRSWSDVHDALGHPSSDRMVPLVQAQLTMAASVAHALGLLPEAEQQTLMSAATGGRGHGGRFLLWIVGAREAMEGELARAGHLAEPLARLCPHLFGRFGLDVVLIGPEMKNWQLERPAAHASQPPLLVRAVSGTLHASSVGGECSIDGGDGDQGGAGVSGSGGATAASGRPNAIVLFNSGIGTLLWPLVEAWLPSISAMLAMDVPILLTCFNERESEGEQMVLGQGFDTKVLVTPRPNPFAYVAPLEVVSEQNCSRLGEHEAADLVAGLAAETEAEEARLAAIAAKRARDREASGGSAAGDSMSPSQIQAMMSAPTASPSAAEVEDSGAHTRSNAFIKWVRGSTLKDMDDLYAPAQTKAAELVKTCAKLFALKNMDAWIGCLDAGAKAADPAKGETVGANCMLLAEATAENHLAALAHQKGAHTALQAVLRLWAPLALKELGGASTGPQLPPAAGVLVPSSGGVSRSEDGAMADTKLTYAGLPAVQRIVSGASAAIENIERLVRQSRAVQVSPSGEAVSLGKERSRWRNVFKGEFINVRAEPNTQSGVVAQLPQGAAMSADCELGGWLRLSGDPQQGIPAGSWVLVHHPMHGALLEPDVAPA